MAQRPAGGEADLMESFRVGITRDLLELQEQTGLDVGVGLLEQVDGVAWAPVGDGGPELSREDVASFDGLLLLKPRVTAATVRDPERLRIIARWGVGFDNIAVDACTRNGVAVTIAPDGVRRPMAVAMLSMILALATNLVPKHDLMRAGDWDRSAHIGTGLTGRTLGLVGLGNIGRELLHLVAPLEMEQLVSDPFLAQPPDGVESVDLPTVMRRSDFICICCPYNASTHHLIDASMLGLARRSARLVNASRGPIVDEAALVEALRDGRLAGAALDVFEHEPLPPDAEVRHLDNVILAPHSLGWTDELVQGNGRSAATALLDWFAGGRPATLLNPEVLTTTQTTSREG